MYPFLRWLFGWLVVAWVVPILLGCGIAMALAGTARNIRLAHPFFALAFFWAIGCVFTWLTDWKVAAITKYFLACVIGGGLFSLALAAFNWVERNHSELVEQQQPTQPLQSSQTQSNPPASKSEPGKKTTKQIQKSSGSKTSQQQQNNSGGTNIQQQGGVNIAQTGNNDQATVTYKKVRYTMRGDRMEWDGGTATIMAGENDAFNKMKNAFAARNWQDLLTLSDAEIAKVPEWLTPLSLKAAALNELCRPNEASDLWQQFIAKTEADPTDQESYAPLVQEARKSIATVKAGQAEPQCAKQPSQ